jgi:hypothetical protein
MISSKMAAILDLFSIDFLTNACVDWSDCGNVPVDDHCYLGFGFRRLSDNHLS